MNGKSSQNSPEKATKILALDVLRNLGFVFKQQQGIGKEGQVKTRERRQREYTNFRFARNSVPIVEGNSSASNLRMSLVETIRRRGRGVSDTSVSQEERT